MGTRINIHQPRHGVVEGDPKARKLLLSTHAAENVLNFDSKTGNQRVATRPGLETIIEGDGTPISALMPVTWATSGEDYQELSETDIEIAYARSASSGGASRSVAADLRGGAYFLSEDGVIHRRTSDGDLQFTAAVPLPNGYTVTPRIVVDPLGGIYVATSSNVGDGRSYLYKFIPRVDDDGVDIGFVHEVRGATVADLCRRGGQIFLAINEPTRSSHIVAIDGAGDGSPFESFRQSTPYPLSEIAHGKGILFTCPPDPERGTGRPIEGDDGLWKITEVTSPETRIHALYDPQYTGDFPDGADVAVLPDSRAIMGIASADDTNRDLQTAHFYNPVSTRGQPPPKFRVAFSDDEPGWIFDAGQGFPEGGGEFIFDNGNSLWNRSLDGAQFAWRVDKALPEDKLRGSTGLWPHTLTHRFIVCWKIRWAPSVPMGMVWSVGGYLGDQVFPPDDSQSLAITIQDDGAATPGFLAGRVAIRGAISGGSLAATGRHSVACPLVDGAYEAIIVLERVPGASSRLRVNGVDIATGFTIHDDRFQSPREVWGNRIWFEGRFQQNGPNAADEWFQGIDSLNGVIQWAGTLLGTTTTTPHDTAVSTAEIELLEGTLAWRRSDGVVLDAGHTYTQGGLVPAAGSISPVFNETETARALRSPDGILGRLSPGDGTVRWAVAGAGIGYALAADQFGNIYTTGPRLADSSLPNDTGPRSQIFRRLVDRGYTVERERASHAELVIAEQPQVGDQFILDPGDGPITFEFGGVGTPSPTYVPVTIGGDAEGSAGLLLVALTQSEFYGVTVHQLGEGVFSIPVLSRQAPSGSPLTSTVSGGGRLRILKPFDGGTTYTGTWEIRAIEGEDQQEPGIHIQALPEGDLFAPLVTASPGARNIMQRIEALTGSVLWQVATNASQETVWDMAPDPRAVNFGPSIESPEFFYAAIDTDLSQRQYRLVSRTPNDDPPTRSATLVVQGGSAYVVDEDGNRSILSMTGNFRSYDPYMQVVDFQGDLYLSDGSLHMVWSPRNGTFEKWESSRGRQIPKGSRIMEVFASRMLHAGSAEDPYSWLASAIDDPTDYDTDPEIPSARQAAASDTGEQSKTEDQVTGLAPLGDDLLAVLGSRTINRMTGDPMAGGFIDNVSRGVGAAFGRAWAHNPKGGLFFFGVPNSLWGMNAGGEDPRNLSYGRIEEQLRTVDLSKYQIRMEYSHRLQALLIVPIPLDLSMVEFDDRWWILDMDGAFWPQRWAKRAHQPTAISASLGSGEPLFGCYDGQVRQLRTVDGKDDGHEFRSFFTVGPFFDRQYHMGSRFSKPVARFESDSPVSWTAYVSDDPMEQGNPVANGAFRPGEPRGGGMKVKGRCLWLEFSAFGSYFGFEGGSFMRNTTGRDK